MIVCIIMYLCDTWVTLNDIEQREINGGIAE